jgi:hypothetical protein
VKLVVITRQPGKIGDIANIDRAPTRRHRVAQFEIFETFYLRIREAASGHYVFQTIICFL